MANNFTFNPSDLRTGSLDFIFGGSVLMILLGGSSFITSILADASSTMVSGCFYITTNNSLMKVNSEFLIVEDFYSQGSEGNYKETLNQDGIEDLNMI